MRAFLIAIAFVICGCAAKAPYFDLRHPVYVAADKSFWLGCEGDTVGDKACRQYRVEQIFAGFNQWFDYFDKDNRPRAVFVHSKKNLPKNPVNNVIHLGISELFCGKIPEKDTWAGACYAWRKQTWFSSGSTRIVFKKIDYITPRIFAHEFGHALGRDDNDVPEGTGSVMSYEIKTTVTPLDVKMMCRMHRECHMVKNQCRK